MNFPRAKYLLVLSCFILAGPAAAWPETGSHFDAGLQAGRAGEFPTAAQEFRASLAAQTASGTLLNLGLAEWRSGHAGAAILFWEQARSLDPFDKDARNNLAFARQNVQLETPELTRCEAIAAWLPADAWAWLACASLWLALALMILPAALRVKKAGWQQTGAAVALGVFILSIPPNVGVVSRSGFGIVLDEKSALRLTPTKEGELVAPLIAGESVRKIRERGNYIYVRTQHGSGWIEKKQLGLFSQPASEIKSD